MRLTISSTTLALLVAVAAADQSATDINWKIRREAIERSQILRTLHVLTDVHGPRLTGSPNLDAASGWAVQRLTEWGLAATLEPWDFGHPGWSNERLSAHLVSPVKDALVVEALAWTPGTNGPLTAPAYHLVVPERVTRTELEAALKPHAGSVSGTIVLIGEPAHVPVTLEPTARRRDEAELRRQFDPVNPIAPPSPTPPATTARDGKPAPLTAREATQLIDEFLVANRAAARINDAGRELGQIRAFNNRTFDVTKAVPTVVMRNEDFGRIARLLADKRPVSLEQDIVNRTWPEGKTAHNVIAEIAGTDLKDEVVMLGGHLDSWHAGTGATDNAVGVAITMEAVRILKALGLQPRRTIRLALWTGEEQGLLGSQSYVKEHFGTFESPKPAYDKFAGYVNVDTGTGRVRGMTVFGPRSAAAALRETLARFEDLGVVGAATTSSRRRGGSDHTSFNEAGLPGIGTLLDPIEYQAATWHTNLDTYERVIESDTQVSAIVVAATVYELATRDERLPRFSKDEMPKRPAEPTPRPETPPQPTTTARTR
jgi:hypothetical protein